jgi:hypothetical protein
MGQRRVKQIRKLSDFEVVLIAFKSLGHLIKSPHHQHIEVKLSSELLQTMSKFEKNEDETSSKEVKTIDEDHSSYLIVDCLANTGHLVKQYIVKVKRSHSTEVESSADLCLYPNCFACVAPPSPHEETKHTRRDLPQGSQQPTQTGTPFAQPQTRKPRPESAGSKAKAM